MSAERRRAAVVGAIYAAALLLALIRLLVHRDLAGAITLGWPAEGDIARVRATAIAAAALAGAALAVSGVQLQALLRNPLASPFILGVSGGAALGVMVAEFAEHRGVHWLRSATDVPPALVGALAALGLVYLLGQRRGWLDPLSLVLVGVIVSAMCGALIMLLQHLVPMGLRGDLVTWMMGHIPELADRRLLLAAAIVVVGGSVAAARLGRAMDALTLADDEARSVGVAIRPVRTAMFVSAGLLASAAVAIAGPIGFVGLIAPHAGRLLLGPRHGPLVIGAAGAGAALLIGADVASQLVQVAGGRMPVGVFTALIGGPAFVWLLRRGGQS
jgi:iron complex transport system permease protein